MTEETLALSETPDAPEPTETEVITEEVGEELKSEELSESSTEEQEPEKPKADPVQKRIDELTRKRRSAERDSEYWREQAMKKQPEPVEPVEEPIKTLADFNYDESAYHQHIFDMVRSGAVDEAKRVLSEDQNQQSQRQKEASFLAKESDFAKGVDDYIEVARRQDLPVTQAMADVVTEMDNGPEVLYFLGKNPDIADNIARLPPLAAARELGRIEFKLESQVKSGETVSKAPSPAPKISTGDPSIKKSLDDLSQKDFNDERRRYIAKNRRR